MTLIPCPTCERQVSELAAACPGCGHPIAPTPNVAPEKGQAEVDGTPTWIAVLGVLLGVVAVLFFIGYLVGSTPEAQEQQKDRAAIKLCQEELKKQPYGSGTESLVRGACEMMENKFEQKYGRRP